MKRALISGAVLVFFLIIGIVATVLHKTNSPPTAIEGSIKTQEDTPVSISLKGTDPDGDLLSFKIVAEPVHGTLSGTEPNLIYTPNANFNGTDSLTFKVNDGTTDSNPVTYSIIVTPFNDPPVAADDNVEIQEDTPLVSINVLGNDTDLDNDKLTILGVTESSHGSTVINNDNETITYTPNKNYSGMDSFSYTISDGEGGTSTATVHIKINPVNDSPVIKSKPVTTTRVWGTYNYQVKAVDPDPEDTLTYSLVTRPEGMTIDSASGLIEWKPTGSQSGDYDVEVKVHDSAGESSSDTQKFTIKVASLDAPLTVTMTVENGYDSHSRKQLMEENKRDPVQQSDDKWLEIQGGSYVSFTFSDTSIPTGATIASVVLYIEHFEDRGFTTGQIQWSIGTGWPDNPEIWDSIDAPIHEDKDNESTDTWDITSIANTPEKLDSLQLQINNTSSLSTQKTAIDYIYVIVKWY